jgi:hypothetical protein
MRVKMFLLVFSFFPVLAYAQNTEVPDWVNSAFIENGIVFFAGYSEAWPRKNVTLHRARSNALDSLFKKVQNNELAGVPPIPVDAKARSTFSNFHNGKKIEGEISDISIVEIWTDDNGGIHALFLCTGIELKKGEPREKSLEEKDLIELYIDSHELEEQAEGIY